MVFSNLESCGFEIKGRVNNDIIYFLARPDDNRMKLLIVVY